MSRDVTFFSACSLDGFLARLDGRVDWLFTEGDFGYAAFLETVDTLVFGRKTLEQVAEFGDWPYGERRGLVFSRRLRQVPLGFPVEIVSGDPTLVIRELWSTPGLGIWLVGGGDLLGQFLVRGLVHRLVLSVHPVILGAGIPMAPGITEDAALDLESVIRCERGLVQLVYRVPGALPTGIQQP